MTAPVRVRCANRQPTLTGEVCGWTGRRKGRRVDTPRGTLQLKPTHERCPRCGSRVEEVPA
jgi:hypothetical protein